MRESRNGRSKFSIEIDCYRRWYVFSNIYNCDIHHYTLCS